MGMERSHEEVPVIVASFYCFIKMSMYIKYLLSISLFFFFNIFSFFFFFLFFDYFDIWLSASFVFFFIVFPIFLFPPPSPNGEISRCIKKGFSMFSCGVLLYFAIHSFIRRNNKIHVICKIYENM